MFTQDINSLNKQIAGLQELVRSRSGQNGRHLQTHSNTIVVSLQVLTSGLSAQSQVKMSSGLPLEIKACFPFVVQTGIDVE